MELSEERFNEIKEMTRIHLSQHEKRFNHILGVCKMSEFLAKKYNVDVIKAKIASILHDYAKYDQNVCDLNSKDRKECEKYPFLLHAYLSEYAAKTIFKIDDEDILNAIRNHVIGRTHMSILEKIVFIADFTEEGRTYEECIKCREILLNKGIDEAIVYSYESTMNHIDSNPHPMQVEALNYYKEKLKKY